MKKMNKFSRELIESLSEAVKHAEGKGNSVRIEADDAAIRATQPAQKFKNSTRKGSKC